MTEDSDTEQWRPVPGYEGFYEVSDFGQVRSLDRLIHERSGHVRRKSGRILSPWAAESGHLHLHLRVNGVRRHAPVHVLVLTAFTGPRPAGLESLHDDGDPTNNRLANLAWGTRSQNRLDAVRHGTHNATRKKRCPAGHLLVMPNLRASCARAGYRGCLACHRADGAYRYAAKHGRVLDRRAVADRNYAKIMSRL